MALLILTLTIAIAVGYFAYGDIKKHFEEPVIDWTYCERGWRNEYRKVDL